MSPALEEAQSRIDAPSQIGRTIGSYRVLRQLGQGGMGAVFEVVHQDIGQHAAVKILHPEHSSKQKLVDRFFDEARAISLVQHPGLVKVFDYARLADGTVYILMELLQGESLWDRFTRLREAEAWLPLDQVLRLSRQLAATLAAVHQKGVIHRDLKPENVVIVPDPEAAGGERAKILDFGIAKFAEPGAGSTRRTTVGMVLGTPLYMSPEQCRGDDLLSDRSDVYSLGVMIYEMLAGKPPFDNAAGGMIMASHIFREPPPLRDLQNPPPEAVSQLVNEMLAKDPQSRPTMAQAVSRLESLGVAGSLPALRLPTGGFRLSGMLSTVPRNPSLPLNTVGAGPVTPVPVAGAVRLSGEIPVRRAPLMLLVGLPALLIGGLITFLLLRSPTVPTPPKEQPQGRAALPPRPTTPVIPVTQLPVKPPERAPDAGAATPLKPTEPTIAPDGKVGAPRGKIKNGRGSRSRNPKSHKNGKKDVPFID